MQQLDLYAEYINMISKKIIHGLLCYSKTGLGKTYNTLKILKKSNIDYKYYNGVLTPIEFYKLLYDNNGKIIILDDIETVLENDKFIDLLKACLYSPINERKVTYNTSSKVLEDYPESFEFTGGLIILMNEIRGRKDLSYMALLSRCVKFNLKLDFDTIKKKSLEILEKNELNQEKKERVKEIITNKITAKHDFNFRMLDRLIRFIDYDIYKGEQLFLNSINIDEEVGIIMQIIKENKNVSEQVKEYYRKTGKSKRTFFRKIKNLKQGGYI